MVLTANSKGGYYKNRVCKSLNISRTAFYKSKGRHLRILKHEQVTLNLIKQRRALLPREGGKKLYKAIKPELNKYNLKIGRDKIFEILRKEDLLVKPKKAYHKTTNSRHWFHKYKNQVKNFVPSKPHQLWVSDITYLKLHKGHCYLALITDAYSRKIVGYDISDTLELTGAKRALKMALKQLPNEHKLVHHSDRGVQYCSYEYTGTLIENEVCISMTEENHCYENAMAERVNGILKDEFFLDYRFPNLSSARKASIDAINKYNQVRLHVSLNYKIPGKVHVNAA